MALAVRSFRLTSIWTDTFLDLLDEGVARPSSTLGRLGRRDGYGFIFDALQNRGPQLTGDLATMGKLLSLPWESGTRFWRYYLGLKGRARLEDVSGDQGWAKLVPFRVNLPLPVADRGGASRVVTEPYVYPFGSVLLVTLFWENQDLTPDEVKRMVFDARQQSRFQLVGPDGQLSDFSLSDLARESLDRVREKALGQRPSKPRLLGRPFSIVSVTRADGVDATIALVGGGPIHTLLEALTSGNAAAAPSAATLIENSVPLGKNQITSAAGSVLYARPRGRMVWWSQYFNTDGVSTVSCYHRNLVFASAQVEAQGCFIQDAAALRQQAGSLRSTSLRRCAANASMSLGQLYLGDPATYRARSTMRQIQENDVLPDLNAIREYSGMPSIEKPSAT